MHKLGECTIDDKLATTMDEINFYGEDIVLIIITPTILIKDMALGRIKECIGLNLCKIKCLDKMRDNPLFKKPCFNIWLRMIKERSRWSLNCPTYNLSCHQGSQTTSFNNLNQILRRKMSML